MGSESGPVEPAEGWGGVLVRGGGGWGEGFGDGALNSISLC